MSWQTGARGTQQEVGILVSVDDYNGQIFYIYNATTQYCYKVTVGQLVEDRLLLVCKPYSPARSHSKASSTQIILTLGLKLYEYDLLWVIWRPKGLSCCKIQEDAMSSVATCDANGFAPTASATYFLIGSYSSLDQTLIKLASLRRWCR